MRFSLPTCPACNEALKGLLEQNYIANERGHWDTSSALLRRVFGKCIEVGRRARQNNNVDDEYEAFRLLGTGVSPGHISYRSILNLSPRKVHLTDLYFPPSRSSRFV